MDMRDETIIQQYIEIAQVIDSEGLGYALHAGGYITPDMTDDPELKKHIKQAIESLHFIEDRVSEYLY